MLSKFHIDSSPARLREDLAPRWRAGQVAFEQLLCTRSMEEGSPLSSAVSAQGIVLLLLPGESAPWRTPGRPGRRPTSRGGPAPGGGEVGLLDLVCLAWARRLCQFSSQALCPAPGGFWGNGKRALSKAGGHGFLGAGAQGWG